MPTRRSPRLLRVAAATLALAFSGLPALAQVSGDDPANDPRVQDVAGRLLCYCGCATQTVADCACGVARKERREIRDQLDAGTTPDDVIAAWVETHGAQTLAEPPARGFNLVGWLLPSVLLLISGGLLALWIRSSSRAAQLSEPAAAAAVDPRYLEKLRKELDQLEP